MHSLRPLLLLRRLRAASATAVCLSLAIVTIASALVLAEGDLRPDSGSSDAAIGALEELLREQQETANAPTADRGSSPSSDGAMNAQNAVSIPPPVPVPGFEPLISGRDEGWTPFTHWKRNTDGTVTTEIYRAPTFRKAGGEWRPVRDRVERAAMASSAAANAPDAFRPIHFGKRKDALVRLDLDAGPVTMSAPDLDATDPEVGDDGTVTHRDVAPDTDLRYRVTADGVKEDLVLRSERSPHTFRFHLADRRRPR